MCCTSCRRSDGLATSTSAAVLSSWRRGGGLRVYLDRGWNASAMARCSGSCCRRRASPTIPTRRRQSAPYKNYVTQWGNDPMWDSAFVAGIAPTLATSRSRARRPTLRHMAAAKRAGGRARSAARPDDVVCGGIAMPADRRTGWIVVDERHREASGSLPAHAAIRSRSGRRNGDRGAVGSRPLS